MTAAREVLTHVAGGRIENGCTLREIYRRRWAGISQPAHVRAAIEVLEDHGLAQRRTIDPGGKPREEVEFHPLLRVS